MKQPTTPGPTRTFRDKDGNERHTNMPNAQPRRGEKEVKQAKEVKTTGEKNKYAR